MGSFATPRMLLFRKRQFKRAEKDRYEIGLLHLALCLRDGSACTIGRRSWKSHVGFRRAMIPKNEETRYGAEGHKYPRVGPGDGGLAARLCGGDFGDVTDDGCRTASRRFRPLCASDWAVLLLSKRLRSRSIACAGRPE